MLITRLLTAAVLAGLFIPAILFLPADMWRALCLVIIAWSAMEWSALSGLGARWMQACYATCIAGGTLAAAVFPIPKDGWYLAAAMFWLLAAPWALARGEIPQKPLFKLVMGGIVLIPAALAMIEIRNESAGLLLVLMAIVWISDSSAFFAGRAWGRNKLAPGISPGKTWEGVYGALAAVLVYAIICITTLEVTPGWLPESVSGLLVAAFWLALAIAGIMGDLMESLLKRMAGVKDSGMLLPGHGGILDRIDALLPLLPIAAIFYLR